MVLHHNAGE